MPIHDRSRLLFTLTLLSVLASAPLMAGTASAQSYQITGNVRFQIDDSGLPIPFATGSGPFGGPPVPDGLVVAVPSATVQQVSPGGGLPRNLTIPANQLTAPRVPATLPIFPSNPAVFQIRTSIGVDFPRSPVVFQASGRTGAAVETYQIPSVGMVRYERLANQFGGPGRPLFSGTGSIAFRAGSPAPCTMQAACLVAFQPDTPVSAFGGPFGLTQTLTVPAPSPGVYFANVTFFGQITALGGTLGPGLAHAITGFAGPWTTGRVTVSAPFASPPELVVLSGSDNRTPGGLGSISLVSGGLVKRGGGISQPNVALGWLNLTIVPEPALGWQLAAGLPLLELLRRRRARR